MKHTCKSTGRAAAAVATDEHQCREVLADLLLLLLLPLQDIQEC
jgi:hypothetical protein